MFILFHVSDRREILKAHWQVIGLVDTTCSWITKAITHSKELISGVMGGLKSVWRRTRNKAHDLFVSLIP